MPGERDISCSAVSVAAAVMVCLVLGGPPAAAVTLTLPADAGSPPGGTWVVFLSIDDAAGMLGTDIVVNYDPAVVTATAVSKTGLSAPQILTHNMSPAGLIRVSLYGSQPLSGAGELIGITLEATGPPGSRTVLDIASADLNEGGIPATLMDGQFCIGGTGEEVQDVTGTLLPASTTARFAWTDHPYADSYNLYRGSRPDLADLDCILTGIPGTSVDDDGSMPVPGDLFLYLVTGNTCSGEGSAGQTSAGTDRILPAPCF